jgi:hypothetical protein
LTERIVATLILGWEKHTDGIRLKVSERYLAPVDPELFNVYKSDEKGYFNSLKQAARNGS